MTKTAKTNDRLAHWDEFFSLYGNVPKKLKARLDRFELVRWQARRARRQARTLLDEIDQVKRNLRRPGVKNG